MSSATNPPLSPAELNKLKKIASVAHGKGDFDTAIQNQIQVVNHYNAIGKPDADSSKLLCLFLYGKKDFGAAKTILEHLIKTFPDDPDNYENLGVVLRKLGRVPEAVKALERAVEMVPEKANIHDALAHSYGQLRHFEKCREHGRRSLEIKHQEAISSGVRHPIPKGSPKSFSFTGNNVIAFSLFGKNPRYLRGALRNAQLIPDLYPGWTCRIYHDESVPNETLNQLSALGSELVQCSTPKNFYDGLFWRFLPATDPGVDRFLIRDIDSVVNIKERVAVDQWLASDKFFHVMRDFFSHSELILAGMWGGVGGILPSLDQLMKEFKPKIKATETYDQLFLRLAVWPTISQSLLSHDEVFGSFDSIPYPKYGKLPPGKHIGQNEAALDKG